MCGWPGSSNDARVFRNSSIGIAITEGKGDELIPPGCHLIGDAAYPLSNYLLVPYKDYGKLTPAMTLFNHRLSSTRIVIEQAFGLLIGRFRKLK